MRVLDRDIGTKIDSWYQDVVAQVREAGRALDIRLGHTGSFGATGEEGDRFVIYLADDLPELALEHTFAHELAHVTQRLEGYPSTQRPTSLGNDSGEAKVGRWISELVLGPDAEQRIAQYNLDTHWEDKQRARNIRQNINTASEGHVPGSFHFVDRSLTYAWGELVLSPGVWLPLRRKFERQLPLVSHAGQRIVAMVREHGWETPEAARDAMLAVVDFLGVSAFVSVLDRQSGLAHRVEAPEGGPEG